MLRRNFITTMFAGLAAFCGLGRKAFGGIHLARVGIQTGPIYMDDSQAPDEFHVVDENMKRICPTHQRENRWCWQEGCAGLSM